MIKSFHMKWQVSRNLYSIVQQKNNPCTSNNLSQRETTKPPLLTWVWLQFMLKRLNIPTHYCWWIWIKLFTYIRTQSPSKRIINKKLYITPLWKSMLNVFLSRWMCPTNTPLDCQYGLCVIESINRRINLASASSCRSFRR
jgi:hypothetical protein